MADNISIKDGAGATVVLASKDVGSVQYPKRIAVDGTGAEVAVATSALQTAGNVLLGDVAEAAPALDTASSGLNGRLQRIAQRITSLIALLPAALGQGTMAQSLRVVLASDHSTVAVGGAGAAGAGAVGNPVRVGGVYKLIMPTLSDGQSGDASLSVNSALFNNPIFGNNAAAAGATTAVALATNSTAAAQIVNAVSRKFNGTSLSHDAMPNATKILPSAAASTNADFIKAAPGNLHVISCFNAAASVRYIKVHNKTSAPTVGTDTPAMVIAVPPGAFNQNFNGHFFATGLAFALTTGAALLDTGSLTAADIVGLTFTYA